jgi:hypothetical protein
MITIDFKKSRKQKPFVEILDTVYYIKEDIKSIP